MATKKPKRVLVTTKHRGVFAGELVGAFSEEKTKIRDARMCVYWTQSMRGILGLASDGPDSSCRVSRAVKGVSELTGCTGIFEISEAAWKRWEAEPWG